MADDRFLTRLEVQGMCSQIFLSKIKLISSRILPPETEDMMQDGLFTCVARKEKDLNQR